MPYHTSGFLGSLRPYVLSGFGDKLIELRVIFEQVTAALMSAPPRSPDGGEEAGQFRIGPYQH